MSNTAFNQINLIRGENLSILKVKRFAQITLPANLRKKFNLTEGDYLEAEAVNQGILLKPVAVVEKEKAWQDVFNSMESVQDIQPNLKQSPKEQEEEIAGMVKAFRK